MRIALVLLLVLLIVPGWTGEERLPLLGDDPVIRAEPVRLDRRIGALTYLGGVALDSPDPAFGGFSALAAEGERFTLLSDGGDLVRFAMGSDRRLRDVRFGALPAGPGTGWRKMDRDSEAMVVHGDVAWVAFERANEIWRYDADFTRGERFARPEAMRGWPKNGGAEAMARMPDGRFVVLSESKRTPDRKGRVGLIFAGDPTRPDATPERFAYRPAEGFLAVDAAALPDGRLLVLERGVGFPLRWRTRLAVVEAGAIRAGTLVVGRELMRLELDNFEGLAVAREGGATVLWLLSDDNQLFLQRTLLLKFRLD